MTSLTESSLIYGLCTNTGTPEKPKKDNNKWYDSVYLCIQNSSISNVSVDGFKCFKFSNFKEADEYFDKKNYKILTGGKEYHRHTMIPICKWVPIRYHKFFINYKLLKLFWVNKITIMVKKD